MIRITIHPQKVYTTDLKETNLPFIAISAHIPIIDILNPIYLRAAAVW